MPRHEELIDLAELERAAEGLARFERNELRERLIEMRIMRPKSFAGLSPPAMLALGYYEQAKRRAELLAVG